MLYTFKTLNIEIAETATEAEIHDLLVALHKEFKNNPGLEDTLMELEEKALEREEALMNAVDGIYNTHQTIF
jgi:hypothetical protein